MKPKYDVSYFPDIVFTNNNIETDERHENLKLPIPFRQYRLANGMDERVVDFYLFNDINKMLRVSVLLSLTPYFQCPQ